MTARTQGSRNLSMDYLIYSTLFFVLLITGGNGQTNSSCYVFGTEHVLTFDSARIDINSKCQFLLASTCPAGVKATAQFKISIQNVMIDEVSKVDCVEVLYASFTVLLCSDQTATVDGKSVTTLLTANSELRVYTGTTGKSVAIYIASSPAEIIVISISPASTVRVSLPDSFQEKLCGLCGNYDGNSTNDLTIANGTDVSSWTLADQGAAIAGSYLIAQEEVLGCQSSSDVLAFVPSDCTPLPTVDMEIIATDHCGVYDTNISPDFGSCITADASLAEMFNSICVYDFCENYITTTENEFSSACLEDGTCVYNSTTAKIAVNRVAEVYAEMCRSIGVEMSTWRSDYLADLSCLGDTIYTFTGEQCPSVCGLTNVPCDTRSRDGCICSSGQYKDGSYACVPEIQCGCSDPSDGSYYSIGNEWLDSTCSTRQTCTATNTITLTQTLCSEFATCQNMNDDYSCVCNGQYAGDGFTCDIQCAAGEQPTGDGRACESCPISTYQPLANQVSCLPCLDGEVTFQLGSIAVSSCTVIELVPESSASISSTECVYDRYDETFPTFIPSDVLPDGLPFGTRTYTSLYTSSNGLISFGKPFIGRDPIGLANLTAADFDQVIAAPYWFRQDLRRYDSASKNDTKLCMTSYNLIDGERERADESEIIISLIDEMLLSSDLLKEVDFTPTFAFVATWYKSFSYPSIWYDTADIVQKEFATYQAVVVTDGQLTYLMYVYPSGDEYVYLRPLNEFRNIYMGFNAQEEDYMFSLYLSSTTEIAGLHAEPSNTAVGSRWVFKAGDRGTISAAGTQCIQWFYYSQLFQSALIENFNNIQCPCNGLTAYIDRTYYYDFSINCAYSLFRWFNGFTISRFQMCCYDPFTLALLSSPTNAGFPIDYIPVLYPLQFAVYDRLPFENCCQRSDFCSLYRLLRPVPSCQLYVAPEIASGFGDPHIFTLDGYLYTYNPVGEFWMIKSTTFLVQARTVQAVDENDDFVKATQFQAYAMRNIANGSVSDRIHIELNNNRTDFLLYKNEESLSHFLDVDEALLMFNGGTIRKTNDTISVSFDSGYTFRFFIRTSIMTCQNMVPSSANGTTRGLLGIYDGNTANDMTNSAGHIVCDPNNCTDKLIHSQFGESWRINPSESIFWYRAGWNSDTYTDLNFEPLFFSELQVNQSIKDVCKDDISCMYDAVQLNSSEIGVETSRSKGENEDARATLANNPPFITGPNRIDATVGQPVTVVYKYNDNEPDDGKIIVTSYPPAATITESADSWMMTWTPTDVYDVVTLSMYALEDQLVNGQNVTSSEVNVQFRISEDCQNGGEPNYNLLIPGGTVTPLYSVYQCNCTLGWEGNKCDVDHNGCDDNPCYNTQCIDIPANETVGIETYMCNATECPMGFNKTADANVDECFDLDECILANAPCPLTLCINTYGSFKCNCATGFAKHGGDGDLCQDIDECDLNLDSCSDICTNVNGSFECSCFTGATLTSDNVTCEVSTVSNTLCGGLYNCSYTCVNGTNGNEECVCPRNLMIDPADNSTCIGFDECLDAADNACDTSTGAVCVDQVNGYSCNCSDGYLISEDGFTCEACKVGKYGKDCRGQCHCTDKAKKCDNILGCTDCNAGWEGDQCVDNIDECVTISNVCPDSSLCIDTNGSYVCNCISGFVRNITDPTSATCDNINECIDSPPCSVNANCEDTEGSYNCACKPGFEGNGLVCYNINECIASPNPCVPLAKCADTEPFYECVCRLGYSGDGKENSTGCSDENECKEATMACPALNSQCINTDGSYVCGCKVYYGGDGYISCTDIDECITGANNCTDLKNGAVKCVNEEPLYSCSRSCDNGYILNETSGEFSCVNIDECDNSTSCPGGNVYCNDTDGSYDCICEEYYEMVSGVCKDIDECITGDYNCTDLRNGAVKCTNEEPLYSCKKDCDNGYILYEAGGEFSCVDIDECASPDICPGGNVYCNNTDGSFDCICEEYYEMVSGVCKDINECTIPAICPDEGRHCVNLELGHDCSCLFGYLEPDCIKNISSNFFLGVRQTLSLPFLIEWGDPDTPEYVEFYENFQKAVAELFNISPGFQGINILEVKANENNLTEVVYEGVYDGNNEPDDLEQRILFALLNNDFTLRFGGSDITDLRQIQFDDVTWNCSSIICQNNFTCRIESYPYCDCSSDYEGYDCSTLMSSTEDPAANLLPLWISVGVASALLVVGLGACCTYFAVSYRRRATAKHRPPIHRGITRSGVRIGRGPALFNPTSRLPTEAYNYQFPTGSVRSFTTESSSSSSSHGTSHRSAPAGRVGSTIPFAPRWPRAYYDQLGEGDD